MYGELAWPGFDLLPVALRHRGRVNGHRVDVQNSEHVKNFVVGENVVKVTLATQKVDDV